jgi:diguanylate cyclase (GGDEF)-like protein/PAS domain S-box-containing protein
LSRDGRIVVVNDAFIRMSGIKQEELSGKDCREVEHLNVLWNNVSACALHRSEQTERITYKNIVLDAFISPVISNGFLNNIIVEFRDVSAYVNLEKEFLKRNKELVVTNALSGIFISSDNIDTVFNELLEKILVVSDLNIGWIVVRGEDGFALKSSLGISYEFRKELETEKFNFMYERFLELKEPMYILEAEDTSEIEYVNREGIVFLAAIPLKAEGEIVGFLFLASRVDLPFDFDVASLFSLLGNNLSLIAEKIQLFQETQRLAVTDDLTGLHNARYFYEVLDSEIVRTKRYETPFSIILFDIDNFKDLNDTYGHQAGDEVLRAVAEIMVKTSRAPDTVARYGGEEFIAVLPNATNEEAYNLALRIKDAIERAQFLGDEAVKISVSGGVASFPDDANDAKSLLYAADMAMYSAKAAGKKLIHCYKKNEEDIQKT